MRLAIAATRMSYVTIEMNVTKKLLLLGIELVMPTSFSQKINLFIRSADIKCKNFSETRIIWWWKSPCVCQ